MKQQPVKAIPFVIGIVLLLMLILFMKKPGATSLKRSDAIVEEFKKVDNDLTTTNRIIDSLNKRSADSMAAKPGK